MQSDRLKKIVRTT